MLDCRASPHCPPTTPPSCRCTPSCTPGCAHGFPALVVWGRNDPIFGPDGALGFAADAPSAEICLLDGGHFLLESHLDAVADRIRPFLERTLP